MVGRSAASRGPSDARNRSAASSSRSDTQTWRKSGADLLAGFNDEFDIEAEPAAARLAHGPKRRQIDAVLPFIVGSATAVDAIAGRRGPPRIEVIAPFSRHAFDNIAVPVHQNRRRR